MYSEDYIYNIYDINDKMENIDNYEHPKFGFVKINDNILYLNELKQITQIIKYNNKIFIEVNNITWIF